MQTLKGLCYLCHKASGIDIPTNSAKMAWCFVSHSRRRAQNLKKKNGGKEDRVTGQQVHVQSQEQAMNFCVQLSAGKSYVLVDRSWKRIHKAKLIITRVPSKWQLGGTSCTLFHLMVTTSQGGWHCHLGHLWRGCRLHFQGVADSGPKSWLSFPHDILFDLWSWWNHRWILLLCISIMLLAAVSESQGFGFESQNFPSWAVQRATSIKPPASSATKWRKG